jgi:Kef-type K+ transport system membrane component KefB
MDILTNNAIAMLASAGEHGRFLLILFVILLAAKLMAELFERLRQPAVVGEILAGVALSEVTDETDLHHQSQALTEFTKPFFLVNIGLKLNLSLFLSAEVLIMSVVVTVLAILTKMIGCGLPALRMGRWRAMQIGVGMVPRGRHSGRAK